MNILINLSNNLTGGGLQVGISFVYECRKFGGNIYNVVLGNPASKQIVKAEFPENFTFYDVETFPQSTLNKRMSKLEEQIKPDVVYTQFGPCYWKPEALHIMGFANPFYGVKSSYIRRLPVKDKMMLFLRKTIHKWDVNRSADVIISETEEASERFKKTFKSVKKFYVVSNNCSRLYFDFVENQKERCITQSNKNFSLITITTYREHKNLRKIPLILKELENRGITNVDFYLTISQEDFDLNFEKNPHIINLGPQKAVDCPSCYAKCDALFLPTYLECFSASYPEAMVMGKPILTSDLPFAHSICDDAALFFDPDSYLDMTEKIIHLIKDSELYQDLVKKGYERVKFFPNPTEKTAQYLSIIEREVNNH